MKTRKITAVALVLTLLLTGCNSLFSGDTTVILPKQEELLPSASFEYTDAASIGKFDNLEGIEAFPMPAEYNKEVLDFHIIGVWQENGQSCMAYAYQTLIDTPEYKAAREEYEKKCVVYQEYRRKYDAHNEYRKQEAAYKRYLAYLESDEYKIFKKSADYQEYLRTGRLPDYIMPPPPKPVPVELPVGIPKPTEDKIPPRDMVTEVIIRRGLSKEGTFQTIFRQFTQPFDELTLYVASYNKTGGLGGQPEMFFIAFGHSVYYITPEGVTVRCVNFDGADSQLMHVISDPWQYQKTEITNIVPCGNNSGFVVELLLSKTPIDENTELPPEDTTFSADVSFEIIGDVGKLYTPNNEFGATKVPTFVPSTYTLWQDDFLLVWKNVNRSGLPFLVDGTLKLSETAVRYREGAWRFFEAPSLSYRDVVNDLGIITGRNFFGSSGSYSTLVELRGEACSYAPLNNQYYVRYTDTTWTHFPTGLQMPGKNGYVASAHVNDGMSFNLSRSTKRTVSSEEKIMKVEAIDTYNYGVFTDKGIYFCNCNDYGVPFSKSRYLLYPVIDHSAINNTPSIDGTPSPQTQETINRRKKLSKEKENGKPPATEKEDLDQYGLNQKEMDDYGVGGSKKEADSQLLLQNIPAYELYGGQNLIFLSNTRVLVTSISSGAVLCEMDSTGKWMAKTVMEYPLYYSWPLGNNRYVALGFSKNDKKYTKADIANARFLYYTLDEAN
ncbi:MAG: hypothetical protein RR276_04090 [Angelakisella sp.]